MIDALRAATGADVSRETEGRLKKYGGLLLTANEQQNLIAKSTVGQLWDRHILDSAQLLRLLPVGPRADVGSGAGLPGMVLAILSDEPITLIEPRRLRVEFLRHCISELALTHADVVHAKAERATGKYAAITARAVASVDALFAAAHHLSHPETVWVLPKGQRGQSELAEAQASWQGRFRTEPSITEAGAVIVVASHVAPKRKGRG